MENLTEILNKYWGYSTFNHPQKEIIESILSHQNTLAILPTGGGKSICYQLPSLLLDGLTLVISPLIALMQDQVQSLKNKGISAESITSQLDWEEIESVLVRCKLNEIKLLYVAPERLQNKQFIQTLSTLKVSLIAVDEAHCITQWGHDFRPAYKKIVQIKSFFPQAVTLALTATATPKVQAEIIDSLQLKNTQIFKNSLKRNNLTYQIKESFSKLDDLVYELRKTPGPGIIFVRTRKQTFEISNFLTEQGFDADYFHAKLSAEEKKSKQLNWTKSDTQIMVSTNAFGMGIDKPNVRIVLHLDLPDSIESYMQETGRAGRDGLQSVVTLLYNKSAIAQQEKIFQSDLPNKSEFEYIARMLYNHFEIGENERFDQPYKLDLIQFIRKFKLNKRKTLKTLEFLEQKEIIYLEKHNTYSTVHLIDKPNFHSGLSKTRNQILEFLIRSHPGIIHEEKPINEFQIAHTINKSTKKIRKTLTQLDQEGILKYNNRTIKKIYFLKPRETNQIKNIGWREFEQIQINKWKRLQEMIYFVTQTEICREKLLYRYFGEKPKQNCGKCDICQNQHQEIDTEKILAFLEHSPQSTQEILQHFITSPRKSVLQKIQELLDENLIQQKGIDTFLKR